LLYEANGTNYPPQARILRRSGNCFECPTDWMESGLIRGWRNTNTVADASQYGRATFVYRPICFDGFERLAAFSLAFGNVRLRLMRIGLIRSSQSDRPACVETDDRGTARFIRDAWHTVRRGMRIPSGPILADAPLTAARASRARSRRTCPCKKTTNRRILAMKRRPMRLASAKAPAAFAGAPAWWRGSLVRFAEGRAASYRESVEVEASRHGARRRPRVSDCGRRCALVCVSAR